MKCSNCPLFEYYESEDGSYANCGLFGDDWENRFQYEDKDGETIGCYIERSYIERMARKRDKMFACTPFMALTDDIRNNGYKDICDICKYHDENTDCECDCAECQKPCTCQNCFDCSNWKWRGDKV